MAATETGPRPSASGLQSCARLCEGERKYMYGLHNGLLVVTASLSFMRFNPLQEHIRMHHECALTALLPATLSRAHVCAEHDTCVTQRHMGLSCSDC